MIATDAPSCAAASAARCPARPAPMISTSWEGTSLDCISGRAGTRRRVGGARGGGVGAWGMAGERHPGAAPVFGTAAMRHARSDEPVRVELGPAPGPNATTAPGGRDECRVLAGLGGDYAALVAR